MLRFLSLLLTVCVFTFSICAEEKTPAPPVTPTPAPATPPASDVPKGEIIKFTFEQSKIFPGTTRDVWVYVPKQYDPAKPACLHVNQDGVQFKMPEVLDRMIAAKEVPVIIVVFIMHGRVKAPNGEALDRYNRSYEYDGLGDGYARFVMDELLPEIEKKKTADGREIKISKDPNDHSIGGSSSGAICAFNAAWERPDLFRRVLSTIGTYVGLRGANEFPTLIRKVEPKPLRVFLHDGSNDLNIYAGDWFMVNQEMQRALLFAGYEHDFKWGTGGHDASMAAQMLPDILKFLWKDWPKPITVGKGSKQMQDVLLPDEGWQVVVEGLKAPQGLASGPKGEIYFHEADGKLSKIGADGKPAVIGDTVLTGGAAMGPDGKVYAVASDNLTLPRGDETIVKKDYKLIAISEDGKSSNILSQTAVHDLVVKNNGNIYATVPMTSQVLLITPKGEGKTVDTGLKYPTGVALSTDQTLLYVAEGSTHWIYSYQIQADGSLAYKQRYYWMHMPDDIDESGAETMAVDRDGRLYVATHMGVQFCDQAGRVNGILTPPGGRVLSLAWGGETFDTLYVSVADKIFKRKLKVKGAPSFLAPSKPEKPRL